MAPDTAELMRRSKLEDELLDIIERRDDFTTSDLQGIIGAFVAKNCPAPSAN